MKKILLSFLISNKSYLSIIGLFLLTIANSCDQKNSQVTKNEINSFIEMAQTESIEMFKEWDVFKRSGGFVFNFKDKVHVLLLISDEEKGLMFKEIFPKQDSVFSRLIEIEKRSIQYPFGVTDFGEKVHLYQKLKVDRVNSIIENCLILFINENYTIIYSEKGLDIRELNRFKEYSKYDNYWYYYLKQ
jgi:hypothetical protein